MKNIYYQSLKIKSEQDLEKFVSENKKVTINNYYEQLLFEKFTVERPDIYFNKEIQAAEFSKYLKAQKINLKIDGSWLFNSSQNQLFHLLSKKDYYLLRTVRNRDLINSEEQSILNNKTIAVAGLSVGLNVLIAMVRLGIGDHYKIADNDVVSLSNINRSVYSLADLNKPKTDIAVREVLGIDPFAKIDIYDQGLASSTLKDFLKGVDLVIDAFDNFTLKLELRKLAKEMKIPVISGFDIDRGCLVIVERYDLDPNLDLNLFLNNFEEELLLNKPADIKELTNLFINIIGKDYHSPRMLDSVYNVGQSLSGYPQLAIATLLTSAAFTLAAESALLNRTKKSYRQFIPLESILFKS